jgi:hypothetical protein
MIIFVCLNYLFNKIIETNELQYQKNIISTIIVDVDRRGVNGTKLSRAESSPNGQQYDTN